MAEDLLELADRMFTGDGDPERPNVFGFTGSLTQFVEGVAFVPSFANVSAFLTDDGLVLADTGSQMMAANVHSQIRGWSPDRLHTAIYTHGHIDHVFGVGIFDQEAKERGWPPPRVVAHENVPPRFDRYILTAGYNAIINRRQFRVPGLMWPTDYRYPDETYRERIEFEVGGKRFQLTHGKGETDDHTWVWVPEHKVLCTGDFFVWVTPNCGNPQKVQRYPREWARALRQMAELPAEFLFPGHGLPIVGTERIRTALGDAATLLESLVEQTLALMNEGARLDEILHTVKPPADLIGKPYLRPIYDEPEFIVRNIWRLYGGWYDGNPANLKPAPDAALAAEVASLAGGPIRLAERALEVAQAGDLRLAGHLAEYAALAAPDDPKVHALRAQVFGMRAQSERSTMSRGIFTWAEEESRRKSEQVNT